MHTAYSLTGGAEFLRGCKNMSVSATPANQQDITALRTVNNKIRNVSGHTGDFLRTLLYHHLVVGRICGKDSVMCLLKTAHTVLQARCSGRSPFSGKSLGIPLERMELVPVGLGKARLDLRIFTH